jgi:hypothetical protein
MLCRHRTCDIKEPNLTLVRTLVTLGLALAACTKTVIVNQCSPVTCEEAGATCGIIEDTCGGEIDCGECWQPPTVDPSRLGVHGVAPEFTIRLPGPATCDTNGGNCVAPAITAGDLQDGDLIFSPAGSGGNWSVTVSRVTVLHDQQRLRLVFTNDRSFVTSPDTQVRLGPCPDGETVPLPDSLEGKSDVEVMYLIPGLCLDWGGGKVKDVQNWSDGDIVQFSVSAGAVYFGAEGGLLLTPPFSP